MMGKLIKLIQLKMSINSSHHFNSLSLGITLIAITISTVSLSTVPLIKPQKLLNIESYSFATNDIMNWAESALNFFEYSHCITSNFGSENECFKLGNVLKKSVSVYIGYFQGSNENLNSNGIESDTNTFTYSLEKNIPSISPNDLSFKRIRKSSSESSPSSSSSIIIENQEKVFAIFPHSSNMKSAEEHDAIIVLDPFTGYNFGHPIGVFYVDLLIDPNKCSRKDQIITQDGTCLSLVKKMRCPEISSNIPNEFQQFKNNNPNRCYMEFLPTVHPHSSFTSPKSSENLLKCINLPNFANCPIHQRILSDSIQNEPQDILKTKCKLFQRCDRGILIGGGWNSLHFPTQIYSNILKMESLLLSNGFLKDNLKIFFGLGGKRSNYPLEKEAKVNEASSTYFHSLTLKNSLRNHIMKICNSKHCADTLFIYLNTPTTIDGDFLLWDNNQNGIADENEIYKLEEFLSDISSCEAKRIIIVADLSRTENFISFVKKSSSHSNVILFTAGMPDQQTFNGELTGIWANHSHPMSCLGHIQQASNLWMKNSSTIISSLHSTLDLSISGGPCGDFYSKELRPLYQGCQNLPTSIWFSLNYGEIGESSSEDDEDEGLISSGDGKRSRDTTNISYFTSSRRYT